MSTSENKDKQTSKQKTEGGKEDKTFHGKETGKNVETEKKKTKDRPDINTQADQE